ncbi:MAG: ABC transporter ATP-binding protein [Acidobacteriota bacterium]|nr:ABC transporter ATP-binding protein [Acidobacteriota bacterium]
MIWILILNAVISASAAFIDPVAMKMLIDDGLMKQDFNLFIILVVVIIGFGILLRLGSLWQQLLSQKLRNSVSRTLATRMLEVYYKVPYDEVSKNKDGYHLSRVYEEPNKVSQSGISLIVGLSEAIVTFITALCVSLWLSWRVTVILSVIVPILYYLSKKFGAKITRQSKEENEAEANFRGGLGRAVESYKTITTFSLEKKARGSLSSALNNYLSILYRRVKTSGIYNTISGVFLSLAESVVLVVAALDVLFGTMTVGGLLAFMSVFWKLIASVMGIVGKLPEFAKVSGYIMRMEEFEALAKEREANSNTTITLKDMSFGYQTNTMFKDFNLNLAAGEKMLILGPNGCGKSTLAHIITGFLSAEGKVDVFDLNRVSAMTAPLAFFQGTLREHLDLDNLTEEKSKLAWEMIRDFQMEENLDRDPATFSEGEKRKAYAAMTLLKDADLYLLDEPLAAVDVGSKDALMDWIFKRTAGKSLIVIMHGDESFYKHFDQVVDLPNLKQLELVEV